MGIFPRRSVGSRLVRAVLALVLVGCATRADAGSIVFTDRTQFNAVAQPNQVENFDGPPPPCVNVPFTCTITYSGLTFHFDSIDIPYPPGPPPTTPIGFIEVGPFFGVGASFAPLSSIGFDVGPLTPPLQVSVAPILLQPGGSTVFGPSVLVTQPGFLGFVGTEGTYLTGLSFLPDQTGGFGSGSFASIDNVAFSVPEPASLLLFAVGASFIAARRRSLTHRSR